MHKTIFIAITLLFLVLSVVISPDTALQASLSGISIWWKLVFPGLLPFLILYELMLAFGIIHGFNALLAPTLSKILRLPQAAATPLLMGAISGFPTGVEPTLKLLQDGQLTTKQAQRLLAYLHLPNPIFIVVIVGAGIYHFPRFGYFILISIWLAAILLMIIHTKICSTPFTNQPSARIRPYFFQSIQLGHKLDGRSFGKVLGDSVYQSVQKLFTIGGFIIFASVIASFIHPFTNLLWPQFPFIEQVLLEQHIGSFAIANWALAQQQLMFSLALIAACLSFTGISGILQVTFYSYNYKDIRIRPFITYRIAHAGLSFIIFILLWKPLSQLFQFLFGSEEQTVWLQQTSPSISIASINIWLESIISSSLLAICFLLIYVFKIRQHK